MGRNTFQNGWVPDAAPALSPNTSYSLAVNAVRRTDKYGAFGLAQEKSTLPGPKLSGPSVGVTHIEEWSATLIFLDDGDSTINIYYHDTGELKHVMSAGELGCDWGFSVCEYVYGEVKKLGGCDDLVLYFSSDCIYRVVNLTEMLDPVRRATVLECEDCSYFNLNTEICAPKMYATTVSNAGGSALGGAYSFAVQLTDADGNDSNWFAASNTVYLGTPNNAPGELSQDSVRLRLYDLDERYSLMRIAVIKKSAGATTAEVFDSIPFNRGGHSFTYYGQKGTPANIATLTTTIKGYLRGQDLLQHDGRLYFYNLKNEKNLNYQQYANNITLDWVSYKVRARFAKQFVLPSFMRGETYAFGIVWNYADGTHSAAFPLGCPARTSGGGIDGISARAASPSFDENYKPYTQGNWKTDGMFNRLRNPPGDESDEAQAAEEALAVNVANFETDLEAMFAAAGCLDSQGQPVCCDDLGNPISAITCDAASEAVKADLQDYTESIRYHMEVMAQMGLDVQPEDVTVGSATSIVQAAKMLVDDMVKSREYKKRGRPTFDYTEGIGNSGPVGSFSGNDPDDPLFDRSDPWVNPDAPNFAREIEEVDSGPMDYASSNVLYPDLKDCEGKRMFPQGNICHHRFPKVHQVPHFESRVNGVRNRHQPNIDVSLDADLFLLGIRAGNIYIPSDDELPKPLCPNHPYSIVYVKRTEENKTVLAAGYTSGVFSGEVFGTEFLYPRHGVNSFESVDRSISSGPNGASRLGAISSAPHYTFHSPDTDLARPALAASTWRDGLTLRGNGWRYGLYAKGQTPTDPQNGRRIDQRGARIANNLNHYIPTNGVERRLDFSVYAEAHRTINAPDDGPSLVNRYRESAVWIKTSTGIPGNETDSSFVGDTLIHEAPTVCNSAYGYLIRSLPGQYGPIQNRAYIRTGIEGQTGQTTVSGLGGDVFISPYSKRRTSYVSNKVGDEWDVPISGGTSTAPKSICDQGDDTIFRLLGMSTNTTELPETGDIFDPRNWPGTHTTQGNNPAPAEAASHGTSLNDTYYPGVLKGLVHTFVESEVNGWFRQTGDPVNGEVFYPELKTLELDSDHPDKSPWENSFLNRFYIKQEQPSRAQLAKKALVRTVITLIVPAATLANLANMESVMEVVGSMFVSSGMSAMWAAAMYTLFTSDRLNNLFGIEPCRSDSEGGEWESNVIGFEDNYNQYNWDYSQVSDAKVFFGIPITYNTCDCDDCDKGRPSGRNRQLNNEIYHTSKQNPDSEIDAYRTIRVNAYNELPVHAGQLQRLFLQNGGMYAHTSEGIWTLQIALGSWPADIGSQLTGEGELLLRPALLRDTGMSEGFAGTNHPNSAINVPGWGYFFIDNKAGKIYRFNGKPEEISAYGTREFFARKLPFCEQNECFDEASSQRYVLGWDHRINRLLVTKLDDGGNWTVSYDPLGPNGQGMWVSTHTYTPDHYFWDRESFFAINGEQIHLHNKGTGFLEFYGEPGEFIVESTFVPEGLKYETLKKVSVVGDATDGSGAHSREFFDSVALYTNRSSTGTRPITLIPDTQQLNSQLGLAKFDPSTIEVRYKYDEWEMTKFFNLIDFTCLPGVIIKEDDCSLVPELNEGILCDAVNVQDRQRRDIGGKYVRIRFTKNPSDTNLLIYAIDFTGQPEGFKKA